MKSLIREGFQMNDGWKEGTLVRCEDTMMDLVGMYRKGDVFILEGPLDSRGRFHIKARDGGKLSGVLGEFVRIER